MTAAMLGWVALGSALGGVARVWVVNRMHVLAGDDFPYGTLLVNLTGALLAGMLVAALPGIVEGTAPLQYQLLLVGMLGSYTTVSSFSLQTLALLRQRRVEAATVNALVSLMGCLLAVALGYGIVVWGGTGP